MKKTTLIISCLLVTLGCFAEELPKSLKNVRKAVFSVITYDKEGNILHNGNGVFIDANGCAISDFTLFKGAAKVITIDAEGIQRPVKWILGADLMYDGVKFQVEPDKKISFLPLATMPAAVGETVYMVPYSTKKENTCEKGIVKETTKMGNDVYYTLEMNSNEKSVSCPLVNVNGELLGLIQSSATSEATLSYAAGAIFLSNLNIGTLSFNDRTLNEIGVPKALPAKIEEALVYLYMRSRQDDKELYFQTINTFIEQFPQSDEGYLQRAFYYINNFSDEEHYALAEEDWASAFKVTTKPDDVHYSKARSVYAVALRDTTLHYSDWSLQKALEETQQAYAIQSLPIYLQQEGSIYFSMTDYERAFDCFYKLKDTNLASAENFYSAARCKELLNSYDSAIALMDSAVAALGTVLTKDAAPYVLERGLMKDRAGRYREAVLDYNRYANLMVDVTLGATFYYLREQAEYKGRMFQQALDDINIAIQLNPANVNYLTEKGLICYRVNYLDEAIEVLNAAIALDAEYADCYYLLGCCQLLKKIDGACENLAKAKALGYMHADEMIEKNCK